MSNALGLPLQEAEYAALLAAQEAVIAALVDGSTTTAASDAAIKVRLVHGEQKGTKAWRSRRALEGRARWIWTWEGPEPGRACT